MDSSKSFHHHFTCGKHTALGVVVLSHGKFCACDYWADRQMMYAEAENMINCAVAQR
jgi:hypothetical protein